MIELLIAILKMLVVLIVCSIGYTIIFAWDVPDKRGEKMVEQLMVGVFFMFVLCIFMLGIIKCLI